MRNGVLIQRDVSIIIVNYNTQDLLRDCLASIYEHTGGIAFEVIVSDNGSTDGSLEMIRTEFPQVIVIENNANLGFGAANNRGLDIAKGKYIFYLNSDTILLNNAVKIFYDFWEIYPNPNDLGALGCNLLDKHGNIHYSYASFPKITHEILATLYRIAVNFVLSILFLIGCKIERKHSIDKYIGEVDVIIGAALFLKRGELAYFDEQYFLMVEETDLEYRLAQNGKKRLLIDGPKIIHLAGGSDVKSKTINFVRQSYIWNKISQIKFFKKQRRSALLIVLFKLAILVLWLNPFYLRLSKKYIMKMLMT